MNITTNRDSSFTVYKKISSLEEDFLKYSIRNERQILKAILLGRLNRLFSEIFQTEINMYLNHLSTECYAVDNKIIQLLIRGIVETGEYSLEGIAHSTRIPLDIIIDAACGKNNQFSITTWTRIVELYMQVKPEITQILFKKIQELRINNLNSFTELLNEQ